MIYNKYRNNQKILNRIELSKNFDLKEFACHCSECFETKVDPILVSGLQQLRNKFGISIKITSGYRCEKHNAAIGGSKTSYHCKGLAADIVTENVDNLEHIYSYAVKYLEFIGAIGRYKKDGKLIRLHLDFRPRISDKIIEWEK